MILEITGRHVEITPALKSYARKRLGRISRLALKGLKADVKLSVEKYRHSAKITVSFGREKVLVKEETDEMYRSIDLAVEKIEKRLRKIKEKQKSRNKLRGRDLPNPDRKKERPSFRTRKPEIVNTFTMDDAISKIKRSKRESLVFFDDEDEKLKLLESGKTGKYEITELIYE